MEQQSETHHTIKLRDDTWERLRRAGRVTGSDEDTITMLLDFWDAYNLDLHHRSPAYLHELVKSCRPFNNDFDTCTPIFTEIVGFDAAITYTVRERHPGGPIGFHRELIITFYIRHGPFCRVQLIRTETASMNLYVPDRTATQSESVFRGWKLVTGLDSVRKSFDTMRNRPVPFEICLPTSSTLTSDDDKNLNRRQRLQVAFWEALIQRINERKIKLFSKNAPKPSNRISAGGGVAGAAYTYTLQKDSVIVSFRVSKSEKVRHLYDKLYQERDRIEALCEEPLEWVDKDQFRYIRTILRQGGLYDEERWPDIQDEMIRVMNSLQSAIQSVL